MLDDTSARKKRAAKSLHRNLAAAHKKAERLLQALEERQTRKARQIITRSTGALLFGLTDKLQDVIHYLELAHQVLPPSLSEKIRNVEIQAQKSVSQAEALSIFSLASHEAFIQLIKDVTEDLEGSAREIERVLAPKPSISVERRSTEENSEKSYHIQNFLSKIQGRGWKLAPHKAEEKDEDRVYRAGARILQECARPVTQLLKQDQLCGLVKFPIVINNGKIPKSILAALNDPIQGYKDAQELFGCYLIVPGAVLMGVHRDLMMGEFNRMKFVEHVPTLLLNNSTNSAILKYMQPTFPAKASGNHFYAPMLPKSILTKTKFELGDWAILKG